MRMLLFVSFGLILLSSCDQNTIDDSNKRNENWAWFIDAKTGEGIWVPVGDSTTLDDGDYTLFFCNSKIRQKGKLKNGKDCDTIFQFDLSEKQISKIIMLPDSTLKEFMPDGKYKSYYPTCELLAEGEIKNNRQVDARKEYYRSGKIKCKTIVNNDTAIIVNYYESGKVSDSARQINKEYDGVGITYYENGVVEIFTTFQNGKEMGLHISYFENGQIDQKSHRYNGLADDTVTDWYESGQMKALRYYIKGKKEGPYTVWYENGKVNVISNFFEDRKNGSYKEYHQNGKLAKEGKYVQGQKKGKWSKYNEEGELIETKQN